MLIIKVYQIRFWKTFFRKDTFKFSQTRKPTHEQSYSNSATYINENEIPARHPVHHQNLINYASCSIVRKEENVFIMLFASEDTPTAQMWKKTTHRV